jgi:hypothetical protein
MNNMPPGKCAWTAACTKAGPLLAFIDGQWFECTDPAKADRPLYCQTHAREFQRLHVPNAISEYGESVHNPRANPLLLFPRKMIDKAIDDGQETMQDGEPTDDALLARDWLEYQPDHQNDEDFFGSFEWCCHWLTLDVSHERTRALECIHVGLFKAYQLAKRAQWQQRQKMLVIKAASLGFDEYYAASNGRAVHIPPPVAAEQSAPR